MTNNSSDKINLMEKNFVNIISLERCNTRKIFHRGILRLYKIFGKHVNRYEHNENTWGFGILV
jgi:hypothetical protein